MSWNAWALLSRIWLSAFERVQIYPLPSTLWNHTEIDHQKLVALRVHKADPNLILVCLQVQASLLKLFLGLVYVGSANCRSSGKNNPDRLDEHIYGVSLPLPHCIFILVISFDHKITSHYGLCQHFLFVYLFTGLFCLDPVGQCIGRHRYLLFWRLFLWWRGWLFYDCCWFVTH